MQASLASIKVSVHDSTIRKRLGEKRHPWESYTKINLLHLYSAFLGTQSALHRKGEPPQPPPMCSIHLDDATAAILRQNAHHTPAYWCREDRVMKPINVWG